MPDGKVSGHIVSAELQACFGLSGVPLTPTVVECMYDDWVQILRLKIINFASREEAEAVVARSGGDLGRMAPAEDWQVRTCLPAAQQADEAAIEALLGVRLSFDAVQLYEGEAAEAQLDAFARQLKGRGALVNVGPCAVQGLPPGFAQCE